jgi:hypothetical protein
MVPYANRLPIYTVHHNGLKCRQRGDLHRAYDLRARIRVAANVANRQRLLATARRHVHAPRLPRIASRAVEEDHNRTSLAVTRPMLEAFFHARYSRSRFSKYAGRHWRRRRGSSRGACALFFERSGSRQASSVCAGGGRAPPPSCAYAANAAAATRRPPTASPFPMTPFASK